jgi:hypothetical protein
MYNHSLITYLTGEAKENDAAPIEAISNGQELFDDTSKDLFNYSKNLYLLLQVCFDEYLSL